jgi:hypothetical protein
MENRLSMIPSAWSRSRLYGLTCSNFVYTCIHQLVDLEYMKCNKIV